MNDSETNNETLPSLQKNTEEEEQVIEPIQKSRNDIAATLFTPFLDQKSNSIKLDEKEGTFQINFSTDNKNQPNTPPHHQTDISTTPHESKEPVGNEFHQLLSEVESEIHDHSNEGKVGEETRTIRSSVPSPTFAEEVHDEEQYESHDDLQEKGSTTVKRKKKTTPKKSSDPHYHPHHSTTLPTTNSTTTPSKLQRGASHASIGVGERTLELTKQRNVATAPNNVHRRTKKVRTNNNTSAEEGFSAHPLTVYHSELVEGKYDRSVIVSILVPEKYVKATIHASRSNSPKNLGSASSGSMTNAPPNSSRVPSLSRQPTVNSVHNADSNEFHSDTDFDDAMSASSASETNRNLRASHTSLAGLVPNKRMKYFIMKVNDVINSREASYTLILRDFNHLTEDFTKEFQLTIAEIEEFYQPYQLHWWKKYFKYFILIYDKPNGAISIIIDKKLIKKFMKKKVDHYFWMKQNLTHSYQSYEEEKGKILSTLELVTSTKGIPKNPLNSPKANSFDETPGEVASSRRGGGEGGSSDNDFDESKVKFLQPEEVATIVKRSPSSSSVRFPTSGKETFPVRKAVDFIIDTDDYPKLDESGGTEVFSPNNELSESVKRKNSRTILQKAQSKSEKLTPTRVDLSVDTTTTFTNSSIDGNESQTNYNSSSGNTERAEGGEESNDVISPSKRNSKTRNSGISKSLPDISVLQRINSTKTIGSQKVNTSSKKHAAAHADKKVTPKHYHPQLSEKSTELLMVAYGRPKDYQPPPSATNAAKTESIDETEKKHKTGTSTKPVKEKHSKLVKKPSASSITVSKSESLSPKSARGNQTILESAVDTSDLVKSPYDAQKKNKPSSPIPRLKSPKSSPKTSGPSSFNKLPSIAATKQSQQSSTYSPKNVFRISNPYSFTYTQLHEQFANPSTTGEQVTSSLPSSPSELPSIHRPNSSKGSPIPGVPTMISTGTSRPLSPISPQSIHQLTAKIYEDANFGPWPIKEILGDNSSLLEDSVNSLASTNRSDSVDGGGGNPIQLAPGYQMKPIDNRALSPFEREVSGLRGSAKVAADIIKKARRQVSGDPKFQVRRVSNAEMKLLNSPFAKKLWVDPKDDPKHSLNKLLDVSSIDSHATEVEKAAALAADSSNSHVPSAMLQNSSRPTTQKPAKRLSMK